MPSLLPTLSLLLLTTTTALLLLLLLPHPSFSADTAKVCSLADATNPVAGDTLFNYPAFASTDAVILTGTPSIVNGQLRLTNEEANGGVVGYAWHNQQERIADGFISTLSFNIPANTLNGGKPGDGFTYFIQNDRIVDLNGGTGDKLGSFGIAKSLAVGVDLCSDRPACTQMQLKVYKTDENYNQYPLGSSPYAIVAPLLPLDDGVNHTLSVTYSGRALGDNAQVIVKLGSMEVTVTAGDLSAWFGSRFAWFGFTASTSWDQTAQINIASWSVVMQPSDIVVKEYQTAALGVTAANPTPLAVQVPFGTVATFKIQRRDTCGNLLTASSMPATVNISAYLFEQPQTVIKYAQDYVYLYPTVTNDTTDGSWMLSFQMPAGFIGKFDLNVYVNGIQAEGMPWIGAIQTYKPAPPLGGLPIWALVLLILLTLLLIIVISYVVYRLHRYRRKLQENAEFIEAGKKQAELDRLEDGTTYVANPMVGTIDDLKSQLEKNQAELERLRKRGELGEDQNYTIEQLQKQRDDLLGEMNRLKREAQEAGVESATAGSFDQVSKGTKNRKAFGAQQVS